MKDEEYGFTDESVSSTTSVVKPKAICHQCNIFNPKAPGRYKCASKNCPKPGPIPGPKDPTDDASKFHAICYYCRVNCHKHDERVKVVQKDTGMFYRCSWYKRKF